MNLEELAKPLDPKNVKSRSKGNFNLSYIEGWWAIMEANRIFGFDGWDRDTMYNKEVCRHEYDKQGTKMYKVGYEAKVAITIVGDRTLTRMGTGHGSGIAKDLFDAIEGAAKEAETDAMKRALMTFGHQFGLALYDKTQKYVQVSPEPIRQEAVDFAVKTYKEILEADDVDDWEGYDKMQAIDRRLTNDERMEVANVFGEEKNPSNKREKYISLVNKYLKHSTADEAA